MNIDERASNAAPPPEGNSAIIFLTLSPQNHLTPCTIPPHTNGYGPTAAKKTTPQIPREKREDKREGCGKEGGEGKAKPVDLPAYPQLLPSGAQKTAHRRGEE